MFMLDNWTIDGKSVTPPLDSSRLKIDLTYPKGTIAEVQPILSLDKLVLTNDSKNAFECARAKYGAYYQIPIQFRFSNLEVFRGYITEPKYLLNIDEIEVKPVSTDSVDGLSEQLSAIESSLLESLYKYEKLEYIVEKVDLRSELLQLSLSTLFYSYVLYTQIKEAIRIVTESIEAVQDAGRLTFGAAIAFALRVLPQATFLALTITQLITYARDAKELLIPTVRRTKVISLFELCRTPLEYIGYDFVTDIDEMKDLYHWRSGDTNTNDHYPRSSDRCGSALGAINFVIEKFNARVFVRNKTVFIVNYYSPLFYNSKPLKLASFPDGNYTENLDDLIGTREHLYSVDFQDEWTLENFQGTEYKIRANIADPQNSTVKGLVQKNYGVALCSRKDKLNLLEKAWQKFANLVNQVAKVFKGSNQSLLIPNRNGTAKISNQFLSVAKILVLKNGRIPADHRQILSAKSDEEKYHWVESHVRNPRRKKRIYEDVLHAYTDKSLSCNINTGLVVTSDGRVGEMIRLSWEKSYDNAEMTFEIEDVTRKINIIETFVEPLK